MGLIDHSIIVDNERHDSRPAVLRWITSVRRERRCVIHPSAVVIRTLQARNQGRRNVTTDVPLPPMRTAPRQKGSDGIFHRIVSKVTVSETVFGQHNCDGIRQMSKSRELRTPTRRLNIVGVARSWRRLPCCVFPNSSGIPCSDHTCAGFRGVLPSPHRIPLSHCGLTDLPA